MEKNKVLISHFVQEGRFELNSYLTHLFKSTKPAGGKDGDSIKMLVSQIKGNFSQINMGYRK